MRILFVGDVVGRPGREAVTSLLPQIIDQYGIDFTVINGENAAAGYGITAKTADELLAAGANVLTSGNHIWSAKETPALLDTHSNILRPANFPPDNPGHGSGVYEARNGAGVGVINLIGRTFMTPVDCPFRRADEELAKIGPHADVVLVDFHAEATSEKQALGYYLDGRVAAVLGTHTHVTTCDEHVLPGGTAYITDVGMTGPLGTVLGVHKEIAVRRFVSGMPERFEVPKGGPAVLAAVIIDVSLDNGLAKDIQRLSWFPSGTPLGGR
jgi:2',3'-cyclic-nucleotide 2'-phosphodiesterase